MTTLTSELFYKESPVFSEQSFEKYFKGPEHLQSVKMYQKCADRMLSSLKQRLDCLHSAVSNLDLPGVSNFAHQMKTSFETVGGIRLTKMCQKLERDCQSMTALELNAFAELIQSGSTEFEKCLRDFIASDAMNVRN